MIEYSAAANCLGVRAADLGLQVVEGGRVLERAFPQPPPPRSLFDETWALAHRLTDTTSLTAL